MRRKLIGIGLTLGLALGTFGLGIVAAQFMTTSSATQTILVNGVSLTITAQSPGAVVNGDGSVTCAAQIINDASGTLAPCAFTVAQAAGSANVAWADVKMTSSIAGGNEFSVEPSVTSAFGGKWEGPGFVAGGKDEAYPLLTTPQRFPGADVNATFFGDHSASNFAWLPLAFSMPISWGASAHPAGLAGAAGTPLGQADYGKVLVITYSISASA
jgi:hypothetical protein